MKYNGIIITGTSCAGKSSIVGEMLKENSEFQEVISYTTRKARRDDHGQYKYIAEKRFIDMLNANKFIVNTEYRGKQYGIAKEEVSKVYKNGKTPILVISPDSFMKIDGREHFLVFFIDADDKELEKRYQKRNGKVADKVYEESVVKDRMYSERAEYILINHEIQKTAALINMLWEFRGIGGKISQNIIEKMMDCDMLIKNGKKEKIQGASYDLTLGDEYYYGGAIKKLSDEQLILKIEPYDYAIVSCNEYINLPKDITANFGLTVGLFCQGIILSNGQQVDPGFRGKLFCLLFNTSNKVVILKRNSHYATIEFSKMLDFAPRYIGKNQNKIDILDYIPTNVMQGAINELKHEIEELKSESKNMQNLYIGVISIIFAAISILLIVN